MSLPIRRHGMGCGLAGVLEVGHVSGDTEVTLTVCTTCWRCIRVAPARARAGRRGYVDAEAEQLLGRDFSEHLGALGLVDDDGALLSAREGHEGITAVDRVRDQGAVVASEPRELGHAA